MGHPGKRAPPMAHHGSPAHGLPLEESADSVPKSVRRGNTFVSMFAESSNMGDSGDESEFYRTSTDLVSKQSIDELMGWHMCSFKDSELEREFDAFRVSKILHQRQVGLGIVGFVMSVLFAFRSLNGLSTPFFTMVSFGAIILPMVIFGIIPRFQPSLRFLDWMSIYPLMAYVVIIVTESRIHYVERTNDFEPECKEVALLFPSLSGLYIALSVAVPLFRVTFKAGVVLNVFGVVYYWIRMSAEIDVGFTEVLNTILALFIFSLSALANEYLMRRNFLHTRKMRAVNRKLVRKVRRLERQSESANFDSPLQTVLDKIDDLMTSPYQQSDADWRASLSEVNDILKANISSLLAPNLRQQIEQGALKVDKETKKWLEEHMDSNKQLHMDTMAATAENPTLDADGMDEIIRQARRKTASDIELPDVNPDLASELAKADTWNFNAHNVAKYTDRPLTHVTMYVMSSFNLFKSLTIPSAEFQQYVSKIEDQYVQHRAAYHHNMHACDVLQGVYFLLKREQIKSMFSDLEIFSALFAALVHDTDHPGKNNGFQSAIFSDLAVRYNDRSVLENHHCSVAFQTLFEMPLDPFRSWAKKDFRKFRQIVIQLVLATDMGEHFALMGRIKTILSSGKELNGSDDSHLLLLQGLLKMADLGNPLRPTEYSLALTNMVLEEFFTQGDAEKELGLPVSPFMDRETTSIPKAQLGFIDFLVEPLVRTISEYVDISELVVCMERNRDLWQERDILSRNVSPAIPTIPTIELSTSAVNEANVADSPAVSRKDVNNQ